MTAAWGAVLVAAITPIVALSSNLLGVWFGKRLERSGEREWSSVRWRVVDRWGWVSIAAAVATVVLVASLVGAVAAWVAGGVVAVGWTVVVAWWGWRRMPLLPIEVLEWLREWRPADGRGGGLPYRQEPAGLAERTYVAQDLSLVDELRAGGYRDATRGEALTLEDLLGKGVHVLVTGEAGVGKSTNLRHFESMLDRRSLAESTRRSGFAAKSSPRWFPLLLAARDLAGKSSIEDALGSAPNGMLTRPPFLAGEWLVLVDAVDEVLNADQRRQVWELLLEAVRTEGPCRFVITSRSVDSSRWRDLGFRGVAHYRLRPFTDEQLRDFAAQHQSSSATPDAASRRRADEFLEHVDRRGLIEVVRLPLLAKLAADLYFDYRDRDLPLRRVDLYEHSIEQWLGKFDATLENEVLRGVPERERDDVHTLLVEMERRFGVAGATDTRAEMLRRFLTDLAGSAKRDDGAITAVNDIAAMLLGVGPSSVPPAMRLAVGRVLEATGLIRDPYHDARFWHQTFAEFLGSATFADGVADDPDSFGRMLDDSETHILAIFTFHHLSAARKSQMMTTLAEPRRLLRYAAVLIAEGLCTESDTEYVVRQLWTNRLDRSGGLHLDDREGLEWWRTVDALRDNSVLSRFLSDICAQSSGPATDRVHATYILAKFGRTECRRQLEQWASAGNTDSEERICAATALTRLKMQHSSALAAIDCGARQRAQRERYSNKLL